MTTLLGKKLGEGGGCSVAIAGGKRQASCNIPGRVLRELCRESTNTTQAISGFHLRWTDAAHSNNYISYACFRCARRCQLQRHTVCIPDVHPVLWQFSRTKQKPHIVHAAAAVLQVEPGGGGKRHDATSIVFLLFSGSFQKRGVISAKCAFIHCMKPPAKVPRTNGCRSKRRASQKGRADKENKHHRTSKHPPWGSTPRPQG